MALNIPNLDRLISYLEALPPAQFHMKYDSKSKHFCGSACCLSGHMPYALEDSWATIGDSLEVSNRDRDEIITPRGWNESEEAVAALYPLSRALRMLRHLRAEYLRTGTVVVDWDAPEAVESPRKPWAPPVVIGADKPLPAALTSFLRDPVDAGL